MAPITAARIEALLLQPRDPEKAGSWNRDCAELICDFRAFEGDIRQNPPKLPDLTRWTSNLRPKCMKCTEFINPLFAWFCISKWPKAADENVSGLFHVLMRCGCDSTAALGATTHDGRVILQFAAESAGFMYDEDEYSDEDDDNDDDEDEDEDHAAAVAARSRKRALVLLMKEPNLPLFSAASAAAAPPDPDSVVDCLSGPYCCAFCTLVFNQLDTYAVDVLARMTPGQRLAILYAPHWGLACACRSSCMGTFVVLWKIARDRMIQPDFGGASEIDRVIGGPASDDKFRLDAFTAAAMFGDGHAWRLVTGAHCPLAAAMLRHANEHSGRQYVSPMTVLYKSELKEEEEDTRGAWLASRLSLDVLNAYGFFGRTPLMVAATCGFTKTLTALLDRGVDVDLTARWIEEADEEEKEEEDKGFKSTVFAADTVERPATYVKTVTAADLLPENSESANFQVIAARLRVETKARFELNSLIAGAVVPILRAAGDAQMPRELVRLCLAYAGLPEPVDLFAPHPSVCVGVKRDAATANAGCSGASVGGSTERKEGSHPKRTRLT